MSKKEMVNHPDHYQSESGVWEVIDVIEESVRDIEDSALAFSVGNSIKYLLRLTKKNSFDEDLKKAKWYLDYSVARLEKLKEAREREENRLIADEKRLIHEEVMDEIGTV